MTYLTHLGIRHALALEIIVLFQRFGIRLSLGFEYLGHVGTIVTVKQMLLISIYHVHRDSPQSIFN
jgi:hypothetical protein